MLPPIDVNAGDAFRKALEPVRRGVKSSPLQKQGKKLVGEVGGQALQRPPLHGPKRALACCFEAYVYKAGRAGPLHLRARTRQQRGCCARLPSVPGWRCAR